MKHYKIYKHPSESIEAIKQGWSWPAFFFGFIWAMIKKMWGIGVGVLIGWFALGVIIGLISLGDTIANPLINVVGFIVSIIFGINGNLWREKNLTTRGFEQVNTITAANPEGAIALHLKEASATQ